MAGLRILVISLFTISTVRGVPVAGYGEERDDLIRDFIRSPEYQFCTQYIFLPGSLSGSSSGGEESQQAGTENDSTDNFNVFQQCMTEAFNQFSEKRSLQKQLSSRQSRSPTPSEESSSEGSGSGASSGSGGSSSGIPGVSNNQFQQCMQNAMSFPGGVNFPFGGKHKRSPSEGGSGSGGSGWSFTDFSKLQQNQFQQCMQNAVSGGGGKTKRSASAGEESSSEGSGSGASSGSGGSSSGIPGVSNNQFQQCMQNAMSFPGGVNFPLGGKHKRSPSEEGSGSGGSGWSFTDFSKLQQNQFQQCMQNAVSGGGSKTKRSASAGEESSSEGSGSGASSSGIPGVSNNQFQQCMQNAMSFPGGVNFPLGGKHKRSPSEEGSGSGGSGWSFTDFSKLQQNQFQQCMQNAVSGGGSKTKRSASAGEESSSEGSGSGGSSSGIPGVSNNQFQQCMQNAMSFPGGVNFPFGGKHKRSPSEGGSGSGGSGWSFTDFSKLQQNQFQQCMQNAVSGGGGKTKRSASAGEESSSEGSGSGASSGSGGSSSGIPGVSNNQFQQCMQNAMSFPGGVNFPFGGKHKRSPSEGGSGSGGSGWSFTDFSKLQQNQFQQCMQNAVSGGGGKTKRSASAGEESSSEGSGSGASSGSGGSSSGIPGVSNNQFQQCMQNAMSFPGGVNFPFGGKHKRSPSEGGSGSGGSGWSFTDFSKLQQNQFQQCMQNAVSGGGDKTKRSLAFERSPFDSTTTMKVSYLTYSKIH